MNPYNSETKFRELLTSQNSGDQPISSAFRRQPAQSLRLSASQLDLDNIGLRALHVMDACAPDFAEFARAVWLNGADTLPYYSHLVQELEFDLIEDPTRVRSENYAAWFAWTIHQRIIKKLGTTPIEALCIELDENSARRIAESFLSDSLPPFCSVDATGAFETLLPFLSKLTTLTKGRLPENFSIIATPARISELVSLLTSFEHENSLPAGAISIEIAISSSEGIIDGNGRVALPSLFDSTGGRLRAIHFDSAGYLNTIEIPAAHHHTRHEACNFMRQLIKLALGHKGICLSDLSSPREFNAADPASIRRAWREHFNNVTYSLADGFYHGIDASPAMLPARYAALYAFFIEALPAQADALKRELCAEVPDLKATQNILNFFYRGLDCGALEIDEVIEATGFTPEELSNRSVSELLSKRGRRAARS